MAFLTAQAQTALTQGGDVTACYGYICRYLGQDQVKNRGTGVHDAAGETHDGQTVLKIAQKEHGAGEHRGSVADNIRTGRFDTAGGVVVRVHTHAAGAEDHIWAPLPHGKHRIPDVFHTVTGVDHLQRLDTRSACDPFRHPSTTWGGEVQYTVGIIGMLRSTHSDKFRTAVQRVCATATMISAALGYRNQEDSL